MSSQPCSSMWYRWMPRTRAAQCAVVRLLVRVHARVMDGDPSRIGRRQGVPASRRRRAPLSASDDPHKGSIAATTIVPMLEIGSMRVKTGLAEMLKGGVIMDVTNAEQALIAEDAGAVAVMALERVPADIRAAGRRRAHGRPGQGERDPGGRDDSGHGQGSHRPLRRGTDPRGARGRLHRRERGADTGRRGAPHRQVGLHRSVRLRLPRARRGACGASPRARR